MLQGKVYREPIQISFKTCGRSGLSPVAMSS